MDEQDRLREAFVDFTSRQPKDDSTRRTYEAHLREHFEGRLKEAVERMWDVPAAMVVTKGEYFPLFREARDLYVNGYFYSCVAMCGITAERLVKDVFRSSLLVKTKDKPQSPPDVAFDQLERVEVSGIIRFLGKAGLLSDAATRAATSLLTLRNSYAHARGKNPQEDALKAVEHLQKVAEDVVSLLPPGS